MDMLYKEFKQKIKNKEIFVMLFSIDGYNHYNNCCIKTRFDSLPNGDKVYIIACKLTKDSTEEVSFLNKFKDDYKLFNFGRKGTYTLEQVWNKIVLKENENI